MIIHTYKYTYIKLYKKINRDSGESYLSYIVILKYFPRRIYNILFINYLFPNIRV